MALAIFSNDFFHINVDATIRQALMEGGYQLTAFFRQRSQAGV